MTDEPPVLLTRDADDPAVVVLTLNRPARYNALTVELKSALRASLALLADADDVRAAVLTGAGKAFCVGQDLGEHAEALAADPGSSFNTVVEHYNPIVTELTELPFPTVAAINGPCVGAGLGFAMACDLRVAAAGLKLSTAFTGIGLTADSGLSASLAHAVGVPRAMELLLLNEPFTSEDALAWGLVRTVVPPEDVLGSAAGAGPTAGDRPDEGLRRGAARGAVRRGERAARGAGRRGRRTGPAGAHRRPRGRGGRFPRQAQADLPGQVTPDARMSTARARRTPHGQDSLMEIAVGEFITRGYDATSMEDLSRAAGITKSSFYHHFASKEALLRAALDRSLAGLFALLEEPGATTGTPLQRLRHIVRGQVAVLQRELPYVTLLLRVRGNTESERWALARRREFDARLAELVRAAVEAGELRAGVDPILAARMLSGLVNSVVEWYRPGRPGAADLPDEVARAAFDGILPAAV